MSSYSNTCAICLEDILATDPKIITLECKHPFHTPCLSQLRSNKCPICRRHFTKISPEILAQILQRENSDILSRNAESFNNFIRDNEIQSVLLLIRNYVLPPHTYASGNPSFHNVFVEDPLFNQPSVPEPPDPSIIFIVSSLIRALPPSILPPILTLLNTPFQGVTLKTIIENYIVQQLTN